MTTPLLASSRRELEIEIGPEGTRTVYTDREKANELCLKVRELIRENDHIHSLDYQSANELSQPYTLDDYSFVMDAINSRNDIKLKDDNLMRSSDGISVNITRWITFTQRDTEQAAAVSNEGVIAGRSTKIIIKKTLLVSQNAFEALDRHIFSLTSCGKFTRLAKKYGPCCCCLSIIAIVTALNPPKIPYDDNKDD